VMPLNHSNEHLLMIYDWQNFALPSHLLLLLQLFTLSPLLQLDSHDFLLFLCMVIRMEFLLLGQNLVNWTSTFQR
jgi:hypothetical protein